VVRPDRMRENIESANGLIMAEAVMIALVDKGIGRQEAHAMVRKASLQAEAEGTNLYDKLLKVKEVKQAFSREELAQVMDPADYVGQAPQLVDRAVAMAKMPSKRAKKRRK